MSLFKHTFLCVCGSRRVRALVFFIGLAGWLAGFSAQAQITTLTWTKNNVSVANVPFTIYTNESAFSTALSSSYKETFDTLDVANTYSNSPLTFLTGTTPATLLSYNVSSPKNTTHPQRNPTTPDPNGWGAPGGVYAGPLDGNSKGFPGANQFLTTYFQADPLLFNNFSSNINAVGGYFYPTDYYGDWYPGWENYVPPTGFSGIPIAVSVKIGDDIYTTAFSTARSGNYDSKSLLYSTDTYLGLVLSTGSLLSLQIANGGTAGNEGYMTVSEFTVGAGIPEPSTLASFAVGGVLLLALRRVRKA